MSARCRTPRTWRDTFSRVVRDHEARKVERLVGREVDAELAEIFGRSRLAVGGEDEWAECEARWFA